MDTPILTEYYREEDAMKRLALLEKSIAEKEDPKGNEIRRELWQLRYREQSENREQQKADGYLGLWMALEFNRDAGSRWFGVKNARKEIRKHLEKLKFREYQEKSPLHEELLYAECRHLVELYMRLCERDKSYNSMLCGIVTISSEKSKKKLQKDIYETAITLPQSLELTEELEILTRAAKEVYDLHFPEEQPGKGEIEK